MITIAHIRKAYGWLLSLDMILLGGLLIVALGTYGFVEVHDDVSEGDTQAFDRWAIDRVGTFDAPPLVDDIGRDLTALGGISVLALMTAGVAGYLLLCKKYHALVLLLAATVGALLLSTTLK